MSVYPGPAKWSADGGTPALQLGFFFDGAFVRDGAYLPQGLTFDGGAGAALLGSPLGNSVQQSVWLGGDMPMNANRMRGRWQFKVAREADFMRFVEAEGKGLPVELWLDMPTVDIWRIDGADAGATQWQTLRRQPWHIAGVSHATRPPAVTIDGSSMTIITSGTPAVGEVKVTDTGGAIGTIETNASDTSGATYLVLQYHAVMLVVVRRVSRELSNFNRLIVSADLEEHLEGVYTAPAGT